MNQIAQCKTRHSKNSFLKIWMNLLDLFSQLLLWYVSAMARPSGKEIEKPSTDWLGWKLESLWIVFSIFIFSSAHSSLVVTITFKKPAFTGLSFKLFRFVLLFLLI